MSTLVAQTISNGTVSTSSANVIQGSAKAWVNFNGTNGSIYASYNVSSVTRNTTGDYTVNFTNALADANFTVVTAQLDWRTLGVYEPYSSAVTASSVRLLNRIPNSATLNDQPYNGVSIFR